MTTYIGDLSSTAIGALGDDLNARNGGFVFAAAYGVSAANADNSDAFDALIAALNTGDRVVLPRGRLKVSRTVTWPGGITVQGGGSGPSADGTAIEGITAGMVIMRAGSSTNLNEFGIWGNDVAAYGLVIPGLVAAGTNKVKVMSVRIQQCTEAGLVLNDCQNSGFYDMLIKQCKVNVLCLGVNALCTFFNLSTDNFGGTDPDERHVAFRDAHPGFTVNNVRANRHMLFVGGILERGAGDYAIEISNGEGLFRFLGTSVGANTGTANFLVDANVELILEGDFPIASGGKLAIVNDGLVRLGSISTTGAQGKFITELFTLGGGTLVQNTASHTAGLEMLEPESANFAGGVGRWVAAGGGSAAVTWNAKKRMEVTSATTTERVSWSPGNSVGAFPQYRLIRIRFQVTSVTGGSQIRLVTGLNASPWRRTVGDYGVGVHDVVYECQGDEGAFQFTATGTTSTTAEIAWFSATVLGA